MERCSELIDYFKRTRIDHDALFIRELWNFYDSFDIRSNNVSEGYNSRLSKKVTAPDTNIFKIVNICKKEETLYSKKISKVKQNKFKVRAHKTFAFE